MKGSPAAFQTQIHNRSEWAGVACGNSRFTGRVGESYERGRVRVQTSLFPHRSDSAVTHCKRVVLMNMLSDHLGDKKQTAFPCFGGIFLANNLLWWNGLSQKSRRPKCHRLVIINPTLKDELVRDKRAGTRCCCGWPDPMCRSSCSVWCHKWRVTICAID